MTIKFIEVKGHHSQPVLLNIAYIVAVRADPSGAGAIVLLANSGSVSREQHVRETLDEVLVKIDTAGASGRQPYPPTEPQPPAEPQP